VDQVIRLKEGEASILGGIENKQETQNSTGIPGLSQIPILKYLFGSKDHTIQDDEIVFVVVPHVVRSQSIDQQNLRAIDTGEGQTIELRHEGTSAPAAQPAPRPVTPVRPDVGTVNGASAPAAANAALAQMRSAANAIDNPRPAGQPTPPSPFVGRQPQAGQAAPPPAGAPIQAAGPARTASGPAFSMGVPPTPSQGESFQIPIAISGGANVSSVPLHIKYDATKLTLVNVSSGNYLSKDGQAVALVHRDDGPGDLNVVTSRPPGANGVSGDGIVCVLSFQAKASGESNISIRQAAAVDSSQQTVEGQGGQISIVVK